MVVEFDSIDDLYNRVRPALRTRVHEINRSDSLIDALDIWKFLIDSKWKNGSNLTLYDIVSDILSVDYNDVLVYVKNHEVH